MKRVALITDGQGWIVDRISRIYQRHIAGVDLYYMPSLDTQALLHLAAAYRVVHFNNAFVRGLQPFFDCSPARTLVSIRSFRFPPDIPALRPSRFHVIHPDLQTTFPGAHVVPDGVDMQQFAPTRRLRVGMAYHPGQEDFKGHALLQAAAQDLAVDIVAAQNLPHQAMRAFYESLDLYVCASQSEGFAAPVVECLALNIPVMSVRTGVASYLPGMHVVERSVEGLRQGLSRYLTRNQVAHLDWPVICGQIDAVYQAMA